MAQSDSARADPDLPPSGRFVGGEHRLAVRVYFEDTDLSGMVYHANYLRFLERARSDMLRIAGIDHRGSHERGEGVYAVADLAIRYRRPARLDDALLVTSRIGRVRPAGFAIAQALTRGGEPIADADVTVAFVSPNGRACRQPPGWIETFRRLQGESLP